MASKKTTESQTHYETGAVRDDKTDKGRCDLMPLDIVGAVMVDTTLTKIEAFRETGNPQCLYDVIRAFAAKYFMNVPDTPGCPNGDAQAADAAMYLEVAKHFEEGAKHYGENNWQKGIPIESYIDSAVRHYLKFIANWNDERHDRAFIWNLTCCLWTLEHKPELDHFTSKEK